MSDSTLRELKRAVDNETLPMPAARYIATLERLVEATAEAGAARSEKETATGKIAKAIGSLRRRRGTPLNGYRYYSDEQNPSEPPCDICLGWGQLVPVDGSGNWRDCPNNCWYPNKYPDM